MTNYARDFSTKQTPQDQPIPGKPQVANSGGGYSFSVDKWDCLLRFIILGNEGGSYYSSERKMTADNAKNVIVCIQEDGIRVVNTLLDISLKNDLYVYMMHYDDETTIFIFRDENSKINDEV